jgi:hypothetical protein
MPGLTLTIGRMRIGVSDTFLKSNWYNTKNTMGHEEHDESLENMRYPLCFLCLLRELSDLKKRRTSCAIVLPAGDYL